MVHSQKYLDGLLKNRANQRRDVKSFYDNDKGEKAINFKSEVNFRRICAASNYILMSRLQVVSKRKSKIHANTRRKHDALLACRVLRACFSFSELITTKLILTRIPIRTLLILGALHANVTAY